MRSMIPHPETTCRYSRLRRESVLVVLLAIVASASESQAAPYTLTVTASHGSVVASPAKALYNEGEMVKLVPLPDAGYCSTGWSGDARSKSVVLNLTMNSNKAITANFGPWTPPIGVRIPEFGIFETYRMYDDPAKRNPALTYQASAAGGYFTHYVDMGNPNATDTSNPYGSIARPRLTIPWTNVASGAALPEGSVVEIHGGVYETTSNYRYLIAAGTAARPVFIRGPDRDHRALVREQIRMRGSYTILENLEWDGNWTNVGLHFRYTDTFDTDEVVSHHMAVRSCKFHHLIGNAVYVYQSTHDIVVYGNEVYQVKIYTAYDWNDPQQLDSHGMTVIGENLLSNGVQYNQQGVTPFGNYWCLDNYFHEYSGDGFHARTSPEAAPFGLYAQYMYVARNVFGPGKENGIDIKHGYDVILSQNTLFGFTIKPPPHDAPGEAICLNRQGYSNNWWVLYNDISDSVRGISGYQTPNPAYIIGNVIHDLHHDPVRGVIATGIAGGATGPIINNVIYNVERGIDDSDTWGTDAPIINNIISNASQYHIYSRITGYNNLLYQNGSAVVLTGGGTNANGVTANPRFTDAGQDDFRLQTGSPGIDAGTASGVVQQAFDRFTQLYGLDIRKDRNGTPRAGTWDIGAYEYVPEAVGGPSAISDLSVSGASGSSLTLTWTVPGQAGVTSQPSGYDLRYASSPLTEANWSTATPVTGEPTPGAFGQPQSFTITSLTPGTTYSIAMKVLDATGHTSALSNVVSATTTASGNHAPVLAPIGDRSVAENGTLTLTISATDADGDPITYSATGLPTGAGLTGQTFKWTPTYTQAGSYKVTFNASDGKAQTSQTITITVANTDRPPVLADIASQSVKAGSLLTFNLSATDPDGDSLTYSAGTLPSGAALTNQTFAWTPASSQTGTYSVSFTASDGTLTSSKTVSILVGQPNVAPVLAAIGNKSVNEGQALTFTVSATDGNGDAITYAAASLPSGARFSGQTFSWTPAYTQANSYNVTFTASDGQLQTSQTITITVVNVDRPPVLAAIGSKTVNATKLLSFTVSATDPDGGSLTYSAGALPSGAALTGQTFAWTPASNQTGTYPVTFAVSDGQLADSETVSITVTSALSDQKAPVVAQCSPATEAIQVPLNNLVTLHITDANSGVDAASVIIQVDGRVVYQGSVDVYTSPTGRCSRSGTQSDYQFLYQANDTFDFDQTVSVRVKAADLAGNVMNEYAYGFTTEMRAFGQNQPVSTLGGYADSQPVTASDAAGNLWVAWHSGKAGSRDIYVAKRPAGASAFQKPIRLTSDTHDQCNPDLAISAAGAIYVVWQDNRSGSWDIYVAICSDGATFPKAARITSSSHNETNPAVAVDHQTSARVYVTWQDDRNGNQDIYAASSTNNFAGYTGACVTRNTADQIEPDVVVDSGNAVYVFWTDMRNGQADIYAAASSDGTGTWTNLPIVTKPGEQTQPAGAAGAGTTLHLLWVDSGSGNKDVYYALLNGLPSSPVVGVKIVDDTSGADQAAPMIVCGTDQRVFACWTDWRHAAGDTDTDLYVTELRAGEAGTNIFVGDDGTNVNQSEPALGVDRYGEPYVVWTDYRGTTTEIYYAATTFVDPNPLESKVVVASVGATVGTAPTAINGLDDVSLVVPAGACQADLRTSISSILNPPVAALPLVGSYEFGPSGVTFNQPVTVTIPYTVSRTSRRVLPYWYDSVTKALSQEGITEVQNLSISSTLSALQFRTTHLTPYYLVKADAEGAPLAGGGSGGGCALSQHDGDPGLGFVLPYLGLAAVMMVLRLCDRRARRHLDRSAASGAR